MKQKAPGIGKKWKITALLLVIVLLTIWIVRQNTPNDHPPVSFYYWKQSYSLNQQQQHLLRSCQSDELFVKFFDVTYDPATRTAKPVSVIAFDQPPGLRVVPCVYIQNDVFRHPQPELAAHIDGLVQRIAKKNKLDIRELQIDCDWSGTTRNAYFQFLRTLQETNRNRKITCTIRLHQIKYQSETGIPPVKKGVLMCYNMDDLDAFNIDNSIVTVSTLKKYISPSTAYPLELDLALPIYQWGLVFRLGKLTLIANDLPEKELKSPNYKQVKPHVFQVLKNGYLQNAYVCKGDLIRVETATPETLLSMADWLQESNLTFNRLILFHLSQEHSAQYNENTIEKIRHRIP